MAKPEGDGVNLLSLGVMARSRKENERRLPIHPHHLARIPDDLRETAAPEFSSGLPFSPLYLTDDEFAGEIANKTMHGIVHLGWVPDDDGDGYRGQMAVLVKPDGLLGNAYMAAIRPFRHLIVYPAMIRQLDREARGRSGTHAPSLPCLRSN